MFSTPFKTFFNPIVSGFVLLAFFSSVFATCTKAEVEAADTRWAKAIDSNEVKQVVDVYAPDAVLIATVENKPITTQKVAQSISLNFLRPIKMRT